MMTYQLDRSQQNDYQGEGFLNPHPESIKLRIQVLYPPHGFSIRDLSQINLGGELDSRAAKSLLRRSQWERLIGMSRPAGLQRAA